MYRTLQSTFRTRKPHQAVSLFRFYRALFRTYSICTALELKICSFFGVELSNASGIHSLVMGFRLLRALGNCNQAAKNWFPRRGLSRHKSRTSSRGCLLCHATTSWPSHPCRLLGGKCRQVRGCPVLQPSLGRRTYIIFPWLRAGKRREGRN